MEQAGGNPVVCLDTMGHGAYKAIEAPDQGGFNSFNLGRNFNVE
jgi:hypothetical protein